MIVVYLLGAFIFGLIAGIGVARSAMEDLADQLTDTRNRLFDKAQKLAEATKHLHGERG